MNEFEKKTGIKQTVLNEIIVLAKKNHVQKLILFGSRARGDFERTSDIDLAVEGGSIARFASDIEEDTSTLLEYDVIDLSKPMQEALLESIKKEGRIIYEKI
jgi:predicted nucleotidyltransferase